jgi:HAD superfamily hydrolase (TIGR01509 family)
MKYGAVLLDIDGTLIDSNDAHAGAWVDAFAAHGRVVPFGRIRPLVGMGGDKVLSIVAGLDASVGDGRLIVELRQAIFARDYLPHLRPTRGAERFLDWLRHRAIVVSIATSATAQEVKGLLSIIHAESLAASATTSNDAEESKPDPDIVVAALRRGGHPAAQTLMIGDTPYDIEAARRAGVGTIALRSGGWWLDDNLAGAIAIYDDPADLLDHLAASPFGEDRHTGAVQVTR